LLASAVCLPQRLLAQVVVIGPQFVTGDYRETSENLHFQGTGFGAALALNYRKLGVDIAYAQISYDPADAGDAVEGFKTKQFDASARYYIAGPVSAEIGVTNRSVSPTFTAQEVGAARVGIRLSQLVDPAVRFTLKGNYLAGAKFSGGGSAPFGFELALGVSADVVKRRMRLAADYEFQYLSRRTDDGTGDAAVPIQQALLRVGIAGTF
jgi:hypothetical protein